MTRVSHLRGKGVDCDSRAYTDRSGHPRGTAQASVVSGEDASKPDRKDTQMTTGTAMGRVVFVMTMLAGASAFATQNFNHVSKCQITAAGGTWTPAGQFDNTSLAIAVLWCPVDYDIGSPP